MSESLLVEHAGNAVGVLTRRNFTYADSWIEDGFPLSHSFPLNESECTDPALNWFANLLPEGATRERIARRMRLKIDDDFQLLEALGQECAGAFTLRGEGRAKSEDPGYRSITADELDSLSRSKGQLQVLQEEGRLSLAGAQDKLPVRLGSGDELLLPKGNAPSSHILKLPNLEFGAIVENELFCLRLAASIGLPVASARSVKLSKSRGLLVERYDREPLEGDPIDGLPALRRLHQEDVTQALGLSRHAKYEEDDGASLSQVAQLLRDSAQKPALEIRDLLRWLLFNAATGNRDNHSKNLSRLHSVTRGARWQLAPFYDLVNTTSYSKLSSKLSFFLGGAERVEEMRRSHWQEVAQDLGVSPALLFREADRIHSLIVSQLNSVSQEVAEELGSDARLTSVKRAITKSNRSFAASLK